MTILAGLPQAPSRYSPITNPSSAKQRQRYVLDRMAAEGFITTEIAKKTAEEPVVIYVREKYDDMAPYFLETLRQNLVSELGESTVLDKGIKINTTLDLEKQLAAQEGMQKGLRDLDKKQGYRGAAQTLQGQEEMDAFLKKTRSALIDEKTPTRVLMPDGTLIAYEDFQKSKAPETPAKGKAAAAKPATILPWFMKVNEVVHGVVTRVDDTQGLVYVQLPDVMGLIDIKTMAWARKPDSKVRFYQAQITKPSVALKPGDVVEVRIAAEKFDSSDFEDRVAAMNKGKKVPTPLKDIPQFAQYLALELEQEPEVEGALISYDLKKQDVISMVGGYDFRKSKFNRAIQAARQTGSSFKPIVYAAALDAGFTPASVIYDAPIVFKDEASKSKVQKGIKEDEDQDTTWKPANYGAKFGGDILFRDALVQSKNVPTVRIMDKVGVSKVNEYSRRLGIFSPLNLDLSMGLGSSSVTLYEMTKVMGVFANEGKRIRPRMLVSVKARDGKTLLENISLDQRFQTQLQALDQENEEKRKAYLEKLAAATASEAPKDGGDPGAPQHEADLLDQRLKQFRRLYFEDPDQLISPQTAFLITNLLTGVINDPNGTGGRARALGK
ncbi:MAG: S1 RNA-binding domain-containing protein, partial [Bdellovibrionales bacterium]|nr:S1 RNA-binding domain-containing protein [Bdellovibrionales bacterium]